MKSALDLVKRQNSGLARVWLNWIGWDPGVCFEDTVSWSTEPPPFGEAGPMSVMTNVTMIASCLGVSSKEGHVPQLGGGC